ncbi:MAG: hypothetical protein ACK4IX_05580, partial [Candidatus Sericytochromatia bacterium]
MNLILKNLSKKDFFICLFIFLYPLIFKLFQGLDVTDIGFYAVNYQQIFKNPENISYSFIIWLSNIIGGLWIKFFEPLGLLGLNLSGIIVIYVTLLLTYFTLKKYIETSLLLFSLLISEIYIYLYNYTVNYNNLTSLFFILSVYLLQKSLEKEKFIYTFLSSIVLSSSIFVRLPNILGFCFILAINIYLFLSNKDKKNYLYINLIFILGYISGILANLFVMFNLNQLDIFYYSLGILSNKASTSGSTHSINDLVFLFSKEYFFMFVLGFSYLIGTLLIPKLFRSEKLINLIVFISLLSQSLLFWFYYRNTYHANILVLCFFLTITLIISFFIEKNNLYKNIIFLSLIMLVITPLGSNNGILNSTFGMWLAIPIVCNQINKIKFISIKSKLFGNNEILKFNNKDVQVIKCFLLYSLLLSSLIYSIRFTYRDSPNRFLMTYPLKSNMLFGIYTTKERADVLNELLLEIGKYVKEGDYLLTFSDLPLINFVTKTNPYGKNSWLNLYEGNKLEKILTEESSLKDRALPVILLNKYHVASYNWPIEKVEPYGRFDILRSFIKKHN